MRKDKVGILLAAILLVGVCVLLYPALSRYWNSKKQTYEVDNYRRLMSESPKEDYGEYFAQAEEYNASLSMLEVPLWEYGTLKNYDRVLDMHGTGIMGYLTVQKLGIELPIYHGTSDSVLNIACGHMEGSSLPIGGEGTHSVLSAHRGLPHARLFTDLDKLEAGDVFMVTILDRTLFYQVDKVKVTRPDEIDEVRAVAGEDYCTLLTCTPYGINSHRLLVRGARVEMPAPILHVTANAFVVDSLVATPFVAAPILLALLILLMIRYRDKGSKPLIAKEEEE